jgi:hypothetical protein
VGANDTLPLSPVGYEFPRELLANGGREALCTESETRLSKAVEEELMLSDDFRPSRCLERRSKRRLDGGEPVEDRVSAGGGGKERETHFMSGMRARRLPWMIASREINSCLTTSSASMSG